MSRRSFRVLACLAVAAACSHELPSTTPLGRGPLAAAPAAAVTPRSPAPVTAPEPSSDESEAGTFASSAPDAGAADAQAVSGGAAADAGPSAPARPAVALSFAGDFRGKDSNVMRMRGLPSPPPEEDPDARVTVTEQADKTLAFALYGKGGKVACTLHATASGNTARFTAGEKCFDEPGAVGRVSRGTARIDGDVLTLELVFELEFEAGGQTGRGDLEYRFEGRRKN